MLINLLRKIFNSGAREKEDGKLYQSCEKQEGLSECRSLLRIAQEQKNEKLNAEALLTLERIIEIMEQENL